MDINHQSKKISIFKAISWRFFASLDTFVITLFITGETKAALAISFLEIISKTFLFYGHERIWLKICYYLKNNQFKRFKLNAQSMKISLCKSVCWRMIGTLDTMLIAYLITGKIDLMVYIGIIEIFSKILLYFLHERMWIVLVKKLQKMNRYSFS